MSTADSQLVEESQTSGPEIVIPSTPPPGPARKGKPSAARSHATQHKKSALVSPPPPAGSMTPPPSTQYGQYDGTADSPSPKKSLVPQSSFLTSPPSTIRATAVADLPTPDLVEKAGIEELKAMAYDLIAAVRESRMAAAHFNLQYNLLSIESQEAAQRAEVEHQMTRREVEVLQATEYRLRASKSATPRATQSKTGPHFEALTKKYADLEAVIEELERRLRKAKKLIENERDRSELLQEKNVLLKKRIRENREHFSRMKSQSPLFGTPRNDFATPQRKTTAPRFPDSARSHAPFAALLAADQVLSGGPASVPSTPTKPNPPKQSISHIRGAHSLSSLQSTPARSRPATGNTPYDPDSRMSYSAPVSQSLDGASDQYHHDRDSTISVSDDDEAVTDEEVPQSQASSLATNMLRRNPGSQGRTSVTANVERSSSLLQTKLFGMKRKASGEDSVEISAAKKAKLGEVVGLGIGAWGG
jgi:hypothetical protein